ncbi:nipped-B-like protein B isoform X5 [Argopecten irradians]|uniref:nipped-B-like protein B isoform X5 n=1 Tax=Argopecten irradians TaxID=31199 RepID=UPI00371F23D3
MATGDVRSTFAPLMGGSRYQTKKFDTPYGLRPDVEKKEVITKQESDKLPKIILKDSTGQQLNTFTTLQEAIYRAELNVRKSRIGATALEWRLPHGPLPAKPDFSRVGPSMSTYRQKMNNLKKKNRVVSRSLPEYTRYKEVDVDDVAFVAESLNHLPHVPSLSFLRQEFLASPKRYFPIVHSILLHQKLLSETDRRDPEYTFPGFCFGCRQHMLCPGCDRTSKPHYHLDNLYKTTGGLTQARTLQDELKKHYGDNWRLTLPDLLVRKTSKVPSLTKEEMQLIEEELDRTLKSRSDQGQRTFLPPIATAIGQGQDGGKKKTGTASESVDTEDEGILADKQSFGYNEDDSSHDQDRGHQGSIGQSSDYDIDKDSDTEGRSGSRGRSRRRTYKGSGPRSHTTGSAVDFDDDDDRSGYTSSQRTERKGRLYKAPVAFKIKQRKRRLLKSQSPFTKERNLDVPTGPGFKLKQNAKATTKFVDFERKDSNWKEPSKFEIQKSEKDATKFWSPKTQKKKKQHEKRGRHPSPDSGLDSDKMAESVRDEDQENTMPQTLVPEKPKPQLVSTPSSQRIATERPPPVKKEKVKKTRREVKDHEKKRLVNGDRTESNDFSQVQVDQEQESTLISTTEELPPLTNGHAESPELPPIEIPPLPEYVEEKKEVKVKENNRTLIKPLPKPKEAKLPPPPTLKGPKRTVPKTGPKKKSRVPSAEAPVTQEELNDMTDPLDFLTKYCIIHMDRLPFYERIFSNVVETQAPRYERARPLSPRTGMPLAESELPQWGKHELGMFRDLVVISRGQDPEKIGLSPPEQYLEKICYTLEILTDKRKDICASLGELESIKIKKLAERAKEVIKDIIKPNFTPKAPKKGKKKKKKKGQTEEPEAPPPRLTLNDITDEIIVSRIDEKTMKMLCKEADICQINLEMERCNEKLDHIEERMLHLDGEKNILGMYCMEVYFLEQLNNQKPVEFRRAQSALYNKIHPHPDVEMNVDELEGSLQIINNNLLSTKEFEYLFHVLNLPGRRKLNFKLFSIVAALSEKVTQMDPVVRKLINKMDYHALDHKMNRSKDLFALICDGEPTPRGNATASNLAVELTAGGLTPEHIKVVLSKFNREGSGYIDFMDFVMYIPLFIEIHQRIVQNPLDVKFTL